MKAGVPLLIKEKSKNQWHEDDLRTIENFRPLDDNFMRELFRNDLPLAQLVLRIITGIEDLQLTSQETQYDMNRLLGARSICLDVFGTDSKGRKFDLETWQETNLTSSGDTTLSGKTVNIKSPDTTISGTNTDISSCGRISASTDNLTIEQCTDSGSATVKSNDITLSGSNINASATTKVDINSPYIDISGTTTDISGTTGRMRFGTFSVSGDNISASGKTKASIEAPTIEISGTNLNLNGDFSVAPASDDSHVSIIGHDVGIIGVKKTTFNGNRIEFNGGEKFEGYGSVSANANTYLLNVPGVATTKINRAETNISSATITVGSGEYNLSNIIFIIVFSPFFLIFFTIF